MIMPKEATDALRTLKEINESIARMRKSLAEQNKLIAEQNDVLESLKRSIKNTSTDIEGKKDESAHEEE